MLRFFSDGNWPWTSSIIFFLLFSLCGFPPQHASSTTLVRKSAETLVAESKNVVHVKAISKTARYSDDKRKILSDVEFFVIDSLKGDYSEGDTFSLTFEGGKHKNGKALILEGCPIPELEKEFILLLVRRSGTGCPYAGWEQGKLKLIHESKSQKTVVMQGDSSITSLSSGNFITASNTISVSTPALVAGSSSDGRVARVISSYETHKAKTTEALGVEEFKTQLRELIANTPDKDPVQRVVQQTDRPEADPAVFVKPAGQKTLYTKTTPLVDPDNVRTRKEDE